MFTVNATDARRDWSRITDAVVREKPQFVKRTRDYMVMTNLPLFESLLSVYEFTANKFIEDDGSVTLSLNEMDLAENAAAEEEARLQLGQAILEYAEDFYREFPLWSAAPNRKGHIPYVLKALSIDDSRRIGDSLRICQVGEI